MSHTQNPTRIVRNFINKHGRVLLQRLQQNLQDGASDSQIKELYTLNDHQLSVFRALYLRSVPYKLHG